jgi:hypothetical protein
LEAKNAMQSRVDYERSQLNNLVAHSISAARVYMGGGTPVEEGSLAASVRRAVEDALTRLFPEFKLADHSGWNTVATRARQGATDALSAVGWTQDADKHPVCQKIRLFIGTGGKKGSEIRKQFTGVRYGWPQDAVDGALFALLAGSYIRASKNGQPVTVKQLDQGQAGVTDFISEGVSITVSQRIGVRKLLNDMGENCKPNEEAEYLPKMLQRLIDLAKEAGGDPPLPVRPSTTDLEMLKAGGGNELFVNVYDRREELLQKHQTWTRAKAEIAVRKANWELFQKLLQYGRDLYPVKHLLSQAEAVKAQRALLAEPDPVTPLLDEVKDHLRVALTAAYNRYQESYAQEFDKLKATEEWQKLGESARQTILGANKLQPEGALQIGSDAALQTSLQNRSVEEWDTSRAALSSRFEKAREAIIKELQPKAVKVHPSQATLKTEQEVTVYLEKLRKQIMDHVNAGNPVII